MNNMYNKDINSTRNTQITQESGLNQNPYINQGVQLNQQTQEPLSQKTSLITSSDFLKGALIGAAATYLLTNKNAQETIMKAASKGSELFQAGMEELKERYEDAKAQMEASKNQ